jgi:hypothetical protein
MKQHIRNATQQFERPPKKSLSEQIGGMVALFHRAIEYCEKRGGHVFYIEDHDIPTANDAEAMLFCGVCHSHGYIHRKPLNRHGLNATGYVFIYCCGNHKTVNPHQRHRSQRKHWRSVKV